MSPRSRRLTRRGLLVAGAGAATAAAVSAARGQTVPDAAPSTPVLFVLGDSWAAGLHADPDRALGQVAAGLLGWPVVVDAASGTGYLTATSTAAAYPDRLRAAAGPTAGPPGVAVLQGGSNDHGRPAAELLAAARTTAGLVAQLRPSLRLLMLGPGPDPEPVTDEQRGLDAVLAEAARRSGVDYVSMLQEGWVPADRPGLVLDPGNHHPTVAGQRRLGDRLAATVRALHPDLVAAADSPPRSAPA